MKRPILIVDYDPKWVSMYEYERERLSIALGDKVAQIEHIGSTSIPGLASKPTIDIAIGLYNLVEAASSIPVLEGLGYTYEPELEKVLPQRRFLWKGTSEAHTYHLHMTELGSSLWVRPILFRDYLRRHPYEAQWYQELKKALAAQCVDDIDAYIQGRTTFIESILLKAQQQAE